MPDTSAPPRLPVPLNALRAFEAAARNRSIRAAADELGVTPSAISHQLRGLEEALGLKLLHRGTGGLELTEAGGRLAPDLHAGFTRIAGAVQALRETRLQGPLRLSMLPTFAAHWFSPRLTRYPFERAGFELAISTTQDAVDLAAGAADAAVRHGQGLWPGLRADLLFEESVGLFAAPRRAEADAAAMRAALAAMPLFLSRHRRENFARWNATLPGGPIRPASVIEMESADLALRAAMDGAGAALASAELTRQDVATGWLVPLLGHRVPAGGAYWLVYPEGMAADRRIRNLARWMVEAAQEDRAPAPPAAEG